MRAPDVAVSTVERPSAGAAGAAQPPVGAAGPQPHATEFDSILFPGSGPRPSSPPTAPEFFRDLGLDRVVAAVTADRAEYDLVPFFYEGLSDPDAIVHRQEVMRDMEGEPVRRAFAAFAEHMRTVRRHLPTDAKHFLALERQRWQLFAAEAYVDAIEALGRDLAALDLTSRGLRAFRGHLFTYVAGERFRALAAEARAATAALSRIRYCLLIRGNAVTVRRYEGEADYSTVVEEAFRKFRQGAVGDHRCDFRDFWTLNHVEAQIAERVALLHPEAFAALARFSEAHPDFVDPTIARFDREIQFYVAYLEHVERFRRAGLPFCYPRVVPGTKRVLLRATFDLALADTLLRQNASVVCNDVALEGAERIVVVTGPNQGGKTTFARTFGQVHFLARLGCPVPGSEARVALYDHLFTHFERAEGIETLRGKLEDDLVRIRRILDQATPDSIVILNEIFSSTTLEDALFLGREIFVRLCRLDLLGVCVTFLDELSSLNEKTLSMVAAVDPDDPTRRTFRIERRPADGLAHALAVAAAYRVTYRDLRERLRQ